MTTKKPMILFLCTKPQKWLIVSCILMLIFIANTFAFPTQALASGVPGGNIHNNVVRDIDIDKPAIVRILTTLNGTLTVHFTNQTSATFPLNGGRYKLELSGSGAFISSHGDILTADHVVQPPADTSTDTVLQALAAGDVATYINGNFAPATPYSSAEVYSDLTTGVFDSQAQYDAPTSEVYLSTDYTGLTNATSLGSISKSLYAPVDKIEGKSPVDKNDVAIVHVNMDNTPSIPLGDSSAVAQQDNLTIIGFPGNGDIGNLDKPDPTTYLASSLNQIYVSAIKQDANQGTLIQVGGNVEHGDSGGPALNSNGQIVGIVSFTNQDADTPLGTSFLQASNSAKDVLSALSTIDLKPGPFQQAWQQAFTQYAATSTGHWHQASSDFQAIQQKYPDFQAVAAFSAYTTQEAKNEALTQSSPISIYLILLMIVIILLILAIPPFVLARRKKNRRGTVAVTAAPQSYPYTPLHAPAPVFNHQTATTMDTQQPGETVQQPVALEAGNPETVAEPLGANSDASGQVPSVEPDIDASVPTIKADPPRHFNPYAPQPMSWQAFQELASPTSPVSYESYNPSEEPTMYEPTPEEQIEQMPPTQATEDATFPPGAEKSIREERPDSTDKFPKYH